MNLSEIFIRRPVMTILLMLGLLILGISGYKKLPVSDLPNVDFPTIQVSATLPGASPETMATAVATPLEQQFSSIAGIDSMTSSNTLGNTQITIQFDLNRNIDGAAQDVQAAISAASARLPSDMPSLPTYRKINPAVAPIMYLVLRSPNLPLSTVDKYAETLLAQRISMIQGVAQVSVFGSQKYAVRIQLNPDLLAARQLDLNTVMQAVQSNNVNLPTGTLNGPKQNYLIQANGQLEDAKAYRPLVVAYRNGAPVRLQELGKVIDSVENTRLASWYNDKRAVALAVLRQPGANTIATVDAIHAMLPQFQKQLPADIELKVIYDRSESIRASVHEVQFTLVLAGCLVVMVIFLFLRRAQATLIPSIALPLSIIGIFAFMYWLGYSLDNLSLLALTLSVGFVVDDAIVMLENIVRYIERGETPLTAALKGSKEISFTILSMTLSLTVVFVPLLFMGGLLGRLFHEFAVTICVTILLSGFISLSLTPMLCGRLLKLEVAHKESNRFFVQSERYFQKLLALYENSLQWALRHRRIMLGVFGLTLIVTALLFAIVPKGFLPSEDTNQLFAYTESDPAMSFDEMSKRQNQIARLIQQNSDVEGVLSSVGAGGFSVTPNSGRLFVRLKPRDQRRLSSDQLVQALRPQLESVAGINVYLQNTQSIRIGGKVSKSPYQYTLQDTDTKQLNRWAAILTDKISQLPGLQDVTTDVQDTGPQVFVNIQRDKAAKLGITPEQIEMTLANAFGGQQISTIYSTIDNYQVLLELDPSYQTDPSALSRLYLRANSGELVPLNAVAELTQSYGPLTINHQGQLPAITISFNVKLGTSIGDAITEIHKMERGLSLPATLTASFQGTAQAFKDSNQGMGLLLLLAIIVIYILLGMLYESFIHPLTVLSGLPSAGVGALLALLIFHIELDMYAFIGIIMLTGIVKKNAIMMIDFAIEAQRKQGLPAFDAIYSACLTRFRPIMMTTMAALMGVLPIALAFGAGSETRRPLGVAVAGGLVLSQLLTLYITPVIYLYLESLKARWSGRKTAKTVVAKATESVHLEGSH
ncbi:MAG TPA: efflux RND transporter permease subunit [Gammaproteobacteria bacterium]|nr:efflux RND transporter permease subunit [Gammaproteobacteria bacterium]